MAKTKTKEIKTVNDVVVNARQIINGWSSKSANSGRLWGIFPLQMVSKFEKTDEWIKWNMDWFERLGYDTITKQWLKVNKDYNMAGGILDPTDYGIDSTSEDNYVTSIINENEAGNIPIMFFPLVPTIINLFVGEYIKRDSRIIIKAVDEWTQDNRQKEKGEIIIKHLLDKTKQDLEAKYGDAPESKEQIDFGMKIRETELKFKKYTSKAEQWANHMVKWDDVRFHMKELQSQSFRDVLVSDKTRWHIRTLEDDIKPELWNNRYVFSHKPSDKIWDSESTFIGRQMYMSLSEIITNYTHLLDEDDYNAIQSTQLTGHLGTNNNLVNLVAGTNMGDNSKWTDFSQQYPNNITDSTLENHLLQDKVNNQINEWIANKGKGEVDLDNSLKNNMLRVTEVYWRSYAKEAILTVIDELGIKNTEIVNEDYIVSEEPVYDNSLTKKNTKDNLISGEHLDWYWKTEIRFGVKIARRPIGYNAPGINSLDNGVYLSGKPMEMQLGFIPVEGMSLSDRNTESISLTRQMAPFQIGFNIVNNQNIDMLGNALANGKVVMVDQNYIPKKSFDGTWGKDNMNKWLEIIRNNNVALMDGSPQNNPSGTGFSHFQILDFSNTDDIRRNIELGNYFREQAFAVIGVNNQRVGTIAASESATGVQTAQSNSYAQTEYMFEKHLNHLMPRVREMMLNIEQYLASTKPEVRIAYRTEEGLDMLFEMEGKELLLPKLQVYAYSTSDVKALIEKMQNMAMQINTAGAEMSDYMEIMNTDSPSLIIENLKKGEEKRREQQEQQAKQEKEIEESRQAAREKELAAQEKLARDLSEDKLSTERYIAELRELGGIQTDANANSELDSMENLKEFHKQSNFNRELDFKKETSMNDATLKQKEMNFKEKELLSKNNIENKKVEVAKINRNSYDK